MRLLAAALMACGVWWWFPPRVRPTRVGAGDHAPTTRRRTIRRLSPFTACLLAAGSALVLLPGPVGIATASPQGPDQAWPLMPSHQRSVNPSPQRSRRHDTC